MPGPESVENFSALPNSAKSTLSGDTIEVPNISAYFSNNYRNFVTTFYYKSYREQNIIPFIPLKLNYPPEFAFSAIKDQTQSTYLEEYVYPLRNSLFVNGLEPFVENGKARYWGASVFTQSGNPYYTKVTLRYYPSSLSSRIIVWFLINMSCILIWKTARGICLQDE